MAGTEHERRRFITRHDVEDAAAVGRAVRLRRRDTMTDEAAQRAMDLGVAIERDSAAGGPSNRPTGGSSGSGSTSTEALRRAVRAAVIAELGAEPSGLDAAIDRVLEQRR